MANIGEWTGGTVAILPGTTWAAPANLFPTTARAGTGYSLNAATSTVTLPAGPDGYLIVGAFEFEDDSNGRHNPQAQFALAAGTGNFVTGNSSGYNRDASEDRAYVRTWAFIDNPSSAQVQFQWRRDTDAPTGGTVRSHLQATPIYYANHGIYESVEAACPGGDTVNQVGGWSVVSESDTAAIELAADVVTTKGSGRYLCLGSQYWQGIGSSRTQRWHGFRIGGSLDNAARAYSFARNSGNADIGDLFTTIIDGADTLDQIVFRGEAIGAFPNTGASVDANTTGSNPHHAMVVLELHSSAEVFRSRSTTQQAITTAGTRVALTAAGSVDFNDAASFTQASATAINAEVDCDVLLGANVSGGYASSTGARYTGFGEFTLNGTGQTYSVAGDYARGDQSSQDCWGWSANLMSAHAVTSGDDIGLTAGKIAGGEGGTVNALSGWTGIWGINLDTLEDSGTTHALTADSLSATPVLSSPVLGQTHGLVGQGLTAAASISTPALGQSHALAGAGIATAATISSPAFGQVHAFSAEGLASVPVLSSPSLTAGVTHALDAVGLSAAPALSAPVLGQTHALAADGLTAQAALSQPALTHVHALAPQSLSSPVTVSAPALGQVHALIAAGVSAAPVTSEPVLTHIHALVPEGVSAFPVLTAPVLETFDAANAQRAADALWPERTGVAIWNDATGRAEWTDRSAAAQWQDRTGSAIWKDRTAAAIWEEISVDT